MPKDTCSTLSAGAELVLPEQVTVALTELAGAAREGLLALAVGTGLGCWAGFWRPTWTGWSAKGPPQSQSYAVRHGTQPGQVTLGGGGYGSIARGYAAPMMGANCRCRPGRRSLGPSCWTSSPWNGCWPSCPPAATPPDSSRSALGSSRPRAGPRSPRSRAGSWPRPSTPWPSWSPRT
jgi:hypothetical protein